MLSLIVNEIKSSYRMILLSITVALSIMVIVVVFYSLTDFIVPAIGNEYDEKFSEGVTARIQCLEVEDFDILRKLGAHDINFESYGSDQFYFSTIKINGQEVNDVDKEYKCFTKDEPIDVKIQDEITNEDFNYSQNTLVYCNETDAPNYAVGDEISLYLKNGTLAGQYKTIKVMVNNDYVRPYIVFPTKAVIENMDKCGVSISYEIRCNIAKTSHYIDFKRKIEAKDAYCTSGFDDMLSLVNSLKIVFRILAIVFIVISFFTILTISLIIINTREKFIILQKVLGLTNLKIVTIYVAILEIQIIIANCIGCAIGIQFTKYLTNVVYDLYSTICSIENVNYIWMCGLSILISNIAMFPFIAILKRIINKKEIVSIINNKE